MSTPSTWTQLVFAEISPKLVTVTHPTDDHTPHNVLYEIAMELGKIQKTTFVRKLDLNRGEENIPHTNEEIARIHWTRSSIMNRIVPDDIIFQGRSMSKDKFIQKARLGGEESYIIKAQGEEYQWILCNTGEHSLKLVKHGQEATPIARFRRSPHGQPSDIKDGVLEVAQDSRGIIDQVFVSFILVEKWFRDQDKSPRPSPEPGLRRA